MSSPQSEPPVALSLEAVGVQMKILQGLVTGLPTRDILSLVLEGLCTRFPECIAGIWVAERNESGYRLSLAARVHFPVELASVVQLDVDSDRMKTDAALPDVSLGQLHRHFGPQGMGTADWMTIGNSKGQVAGVMGISVAQVDSLSAAELHVIAKYTQVAGLAIEKEQLDLENHRLAYYDYLTSVPNRRLFHQRLQEGMKETLASHGELSILLVDLDKFKQVNDNFGHATGDRVLQVVARRIADTLSEEHTVARIGGDEFGLILTRTSEIAAQEVMRQVLDAIKRPIPWRDGQVQVSASAGVAICPLHGTREDELLRHADVHLYQSKRR